MGFFKEMGEGDAADTGHDQLILYVRGDILPPNCGGRASTIEFVVYATAESLKAATVDDRGMVEVTLREGYSDYEEFGDGWWIFWHREYRACFPQAFLERRALENNWHSSLPPHLISTDGRTVADLSSQAGIDLVLPGEHVSRRAFEEHFHDFEGESRSWRRISSQWHPLMQRVSSLYESPQQHPVRLVAVLIEQDYDTRMGSSRFHKESLLGYARNKRPDMIRAATLDEVYALSCQYSVGHKTCYLILGTCIDHGSSVLYPYIAISGSRRVFGTLCDGYGFGGHGDTYVMGVINT